MNDVLSGLTFEQAERIAKRREVDAVLAAIERPVTLSLEPMTDEPAPSLRGVTFDARFHA